MLELSHGVYLWIKALHIISIIAWMAAMLYLPRLYVYHCDSIIGSEFSEKLKIMERRLLRAIMNPAMIISLALGAMLVVNLGDGALDSGWLQMKLLGVLGLIGFHGLLSKWRKDFETDVNIRSQFFFRMMNEVPTILMIVIVILVVVKPF